VLPNGDEELKETARTSEPANLATYLVYDTERKRAIARLDAAVAEQRTVKIAGNDQSGEALRARAQKLAPADDEKAAYEAALAQLRESLRSF
jgi:hypothetical protein